MSISKTSMEDNQNTNPSIPMERKCRRNTTTGSRNIIRRSIYTFLQNYHYFTSTCAFLALPFSVSILVAQALIPSSSSSLLPTIYTRLHSLFDAAGFPPSSELFTILSLKLSQTISSSIFTLPFAFTFLLITKSSIIKTLDANDHHNKPTLPPSFFSITSLYTPLLHTYICNSFLIISANATAFSILFFAFNLLEGLGFSSANCLLLLSAAGAVLYSIILANALIICNLALVLSGIEGRGGYLAILKACVLIRGRTSTALSLAVPVNLAMAGIEALFQFRVVRAFHHNNHVAHHHQRPGSLIAAEGLFIAYLYSIFVVLDTVVSYMFFRSCKGGSWMDQEARLCYQIEFADDEEMGKSCGDIYIEEIPFP